MYRYFCGCVSANTANISIYCSVTLRENYLSIFAMQLRLTEAKRRKRPFDLGLIYSSCNALAMVKVLGMKLARSFKISLIIQLKLYGAAPCGSRLSLIEIYQYEKSTHVWSTPFISPQLFIMHF